MKKTKLTDRSNREKHFNKNGYYGHPEENVYGKTKGINFMDDELRESSIRSAITGLQGIVDYFRGLWKGKEMTKEIGQEIMKASSRKYELEQELNKLTNKE